MLALQLAQEAGKARFIGITGYPLENFRTLIEKVEQYNKQFQTQEEEEQEVEEDNKKHKKKPIKIDSVLSYCHYTLNDTSLLDYMDYFREKGIACLSGAPIGMGLMSENGPPQWHPASDHIKEACKNASQYCKSKGYYWFLLN